MTAHPVNLFPGWTVSKKYKNGSLYWVFKRSAFTVSYYAEAMVKLMAAVIFTKTAFLGAAALAPSPYTTKSFTGTPTVTTVYPTGTAGCWTTTVVYTPSPSPSATGVPNVSDYRETLQRNKRLTLTNVSCLVGSMWR